MFLIDNSFIKVKTTSKKGKGVFAKKDIAARIVFGDYLGQLFPWEKINFEEEMVNMYLMYFDDNTAIYPNLKKPGVHLLNHSCGPNCFIKKYKKHTIVFTLRKIKAGEELTINYLLPPKDGCVNCTHQCFCGNKNCIKTMHLSNEKYLNWQRFQKNETARTTTHLKSLKPFKKYPSKISESYVANIKSIGLIT